MKGAKKPKALDDEQRQQADVKSAKATKLEDGRTAVTCPECGGKSCEKCNGLGFTYA